MSAGTRRNGSSKFGPLTRTGPSYFGSSGRHHRITGAEYGHDTFAPYHQDAPDHPTVAWEVDVPYGEGPACDGGTPYDGGAAFGEDASYGATVALDADPAYDVDAADGAPEPVGPSFGSGEHAGRYAGRHASSRRKATRKRARQAVPAAVVAAAFAAGAAVYTLAGTGHPQAAQLSDAMSGPLVLSAARAGTGHADAASAMVAAGAASATPHRVAATRTASPSASASPARTAAATAAASPTATPASTATPTASASPTATTVSCNLSYSLLPENVTAIVNFLLANGYTDNAAAGIAGNIYQESQGNPESVGTGGGGLIGWTPLPSGYVTGDPTADLQTQLAAILTYNQEWASYLPALNSAASPSDAADIYVTDFERAGIPATATREASAENVASACGI